MDEYIKSNFEEPLLFRTCEKLVYDNAINDGSLWLRSAHYYRSKETDIARRDGSEGVNFTPHTFPLKFNKKECTIASIEGDGSIGCEIIKCYILSLHGTGIRSDVKRDFGDHTFGIKSLYKLSNDILYQAQKQVDLIAHRYGQVAYQYTPLTLSKNPNSTAIALSNNVFLKSQNTEILRKAPVPPFIYQDEWRVAIFVKDYIDSDEQAILKINVDPECFFGYST